MKKKNVVTFILLFSLVKIFAVEEILFDESTIFKVYSETGFSFTLKDDVSYIKENLGEPISTEEIKSKGKEDFNIIVLYYKNLTIKYYKGSKRVRSIEITGNEYGISNIYINIDTVTFLDLLDYYQEFEDSNYKIENIEENENKIMKVSFKTFNHKYMNVNAGDFDRFVITYHFDYISKKCNRIQLIYYDD